MKHLTSFNLHRWGWLRGLALLLAVLCGPLPPGFGQPSSLPKLAEIKAAAERGEVEAQMSLADEYASRNEIAGATTWYLKAAKQGAARAQYELGGLLGATKPNESFRWFQTAADQGYAKAQMILGNYYRDGTLVRKNYPEAYKWFSLASAQAFEAAITARDTLILKMTEEQVTDGQRRFAAVAPAKQESLAPAASPSLFSLKGITFSKTRSLAIINDQTFERGEEQFVKAGDQKIRVRCEEIRRESVLLAISGSPDKIELRLR